MEGKGQVEVLWYVSVSRVLSQGKIGTDKLAGPFGGNTSFPILFIANRADNVTPLRSARNNAKKFKDSTILVQESFGVGIPTKKFLLEANIITQHTSLAAPSTCTALHIRNYFQEGILPPPDTICKGHIYPFDRFDDEVRTNDEDAKTRNALLGLMKTMDWGPMARF
jgi:hypothetical protein